MSLTIETAPQKQKEYNDHNVRKQDHGGRQSGPRQSPNSEARNEKLRAQADRDHIQVELGQFSLGDTEYARLTDAQRDAITDSMLDGLVPDELVYSSDEHLKELDDSDLEPAELYYPSEAELGLKSRREIGQEMARRVTLDVDYEDDDNGDSDYNVPVRIRNRL